MRALRIAGFVSKTILLYTLLCISIFMMLDAVIDYSYFNTKTRFLAQKQDYLSIDLWVYSFYIHVFTCIICLLAGLSQFSNYLRLSFPKMHKIFGWIYISNILFINFPTGLILAYYANGFLPTKIAFVILDFLWFWFTWKALMAVKSKNFIVHENFMIRSYALTLSAVTLRTWKIILTANLDLEPMTIYMINAWLAFVPNLIIAEYIIRRKNYLSKSV